MSGLGPQLKELRQALGLGQIAFARALEVDQTSLARWETGARPIPVGSVLRIADIAPLEHRQSWLDAAGLAHPAEKKPKPSTLRKIPLLKDAKAAGTVKASRSDEIELMWEVPKAWLPAEGTLQAIRAPDEGMNPMLARGYIAVVDVSRRDPKQLLDALVLARSAEGMVIRWLRRDMGLDLLMPLDLRNHTMIALDSRQGNTLVGQVVLWVGKPTEQ